MPGPLYHRLSSQRRTVLICVMVMILGGSYMVEQPGSSVMPKYKRWVWLSRISRVSRLPMVQHIYIYRAGIYIYDIKKQVISILQWGFAPVIWVVSPSYKVYKIAWWMAHYCALSPKRHMGLTNNVWADKLNKGKLTRKVRKGCTLKTTDRTRSKDGKVGYKGNRNLKSTQFRPQLMHESHVYSHSNRNNIVEFQTSLVYIYIYFPTWAQGLSATVWSRSM